MNKAELFETVRSGEDSTLEFKRDNGPNHDLAKALTAFLKSGRGTILWAVEDEPLIANEVFHAPGPALR